MFRKKGHQYSIFEACHCLIEAKKVIKEMEYLLVARKKVIFDVIMKVTVCNIKRFMRQRIKPLPNPNTPLLQYSNTPGQSFQAKPKNSYYAYRRSRYAGEGVVFQDIIKKKDTA